MWKRREDWDGFLQQRTVIICYIPFFLVLVHCRCVLVIDSLLLYCLGGGLEVFQQQQQQQKFLNMFNTPPYSVPPPISTETGAVPKRYNTRSNARAALTFNVPLSSPRQEPRESDPVGSCNQTMNLTSRLSLPGLPYPQEESTGAQGGASALPNLSEPPPRSSNAQEIQMQIARAMTSLRTDMIDLLRSELSQRRDEERPLEPAWPRDLPPLAPAPTLQNRRERFLVPPPPIFERATAQQAPPSSFPTTENGLQAPQSTTNGLTRQVNNIHTLNKPSIISTWGIRFGGKTSALTVEDFLFRVERLALSSSVQESELCANIHLLLRDEVEGWYWNQFCRGTPGFNWSCFKQRISREFGSSSTDLDLTRALMELRQGSESCDSYLRRAGSLVSRMRTPPPEEDLVQIFKDGLNPKISQQFSTTYVTTIDQLQDLCRRAEHWVNRREISRRFNRPEIHELSDEWADRPGEAWDSVQDPIEEVTRVVNKSQNPTCWNCREAGHTFHFCPSESRKLFCYTCGQPGVVTPKCPKCRPGNGAASGNRWGTRSPTTANKAVSTSP